MNCSAWFIPITLVLLTATGCDTPVTAPAASQPMVALFPNPKAQVWNALAATVGMEFPIQVLERESGLLVTRPSSMALPTSRWALGCENPSDFANAWNQLSLELRVLVEEREPGSTQVTLNCLYEADKQSTSPRAWTRVGSNGTLERLLIENVQGRLKVSGAK